MAVEFNGNEQNLTRAIWYVRYIDWVITTPALLLELVLATGLPLSDIIALIFFDEVMIITGLVGALVASSYKVGISCSGDSAFIADCLRIVSISLVRILRVRLCRPHLHLGHPVGSRAQVICRSRS